MNTHILAEQLHKKAVSCGCLGRFARIRGSYSFLVIELRKKGDSPLRGYILLLRYKSE